ncbi:hypothetical protein pdam_00011031 [Pocillopora damicornis]|uniref:Uncharacterized protein n=1 Tax=Pocillopora damicornis TaxID=46731 RepID=A0A3M6TWY5_POCDA|nr:hypothetical protein pdam_00011031 [Pocillopora damicornis]
MLIVSRRKLDTFNRPLCLTIDSNSIKQVSFTRSLSVYTDKNLPWNILISKHLKKNKTSGIGISRRNFLVYIQINIYLGIDTDNERSKKKLPLALASLGEVAQPHSSSYRGIAINLSQLNYKKLQKRTARILTSSSYDANVDDLFVRLGAGKNLIFDENSKRNYGP